MSDLNLDEIKELSLNQIVVVSNPRTEFADGALKELALSIKTNGVIQPIIVKHISDDQYRLIAGERRYRASLLANKASIPARVMDIPDEKILQIQIIENLQRKNVSVMDEVNAIVLLRDEEAMTTSEISKAIGKSTSHIEYQFTIARAVPELHDALSKNQVSRSVALLIAALDDHSKQQQAVIGLKRDNSAHVVKKGDAESWLQRTFGVQAKRTPSAKKFTSQATKTVSHFESDWKYYLLRFSPEQFEKWQSIVQKQTEITIWAAAVRTVMEESSQSNHAKIGD